MGVSVEFININDKKLLHVACDMQVVPTKGSIVSLCDERKEWFVEKIKWRVMGATSTVSIFLAPCLGVKTL